MGAMAGVAKLSHADINSSVQELSTPLTKAGTLSFPGAVCNLSASAMGAGMLALPSVMGTNGAPRAGFAGGCMLVLVAAAFQHVGNMCISRAIDVSGHECSSLGALARVALGPRGEAFAITVASVSLLGFCTAFVIILGNMLTSITGLEAHIAVAAVGAALIPFALCPLSGRTGAVGTVAPCVIVVLIGVGAVLAVKTGHRSAFGPVEQLGPSFCTIVFGMGFGPIVPAVKADMANPARGAAASDAALAVVTGLYATIMVIGYWAWGNEVQGDVLDSVASGGLAITARAMLTLNILLCYSILMQCIFVGLADNLGIRSHTPQVMLRFCLAVLVGVLGVAVPCFNAFINLVSALTVVVCNYMLPQVCYWALRQRQCGSMQKAIREEPLTCLAHVIVALGGCAAMVTGTIVGVHNLFADLRSLDSHSS